MINTITEHPENNPQPYTGKIAKALYCCLQTAGFYDPVFKSPGGKMCDLFEGDLNRIEDVLADSLFKHCGIEGKYVTSKDRKYFQVLNSILSKLRAIKILNAELRRIEESKIPSSNTELVDKLKVNTQKAVENFKDRVLDYAAKRDNPYSSEFNDTTGLYSVAYMKYVRESVNLAYSEFTNQNTHANQLIFSQEIRQIKTTMENIIHFIRVDIHHLATYTYVDDSSRSEVPAFADLAETYPRALIEERFPNVAKDSFDKNVSEWGFLRESIKGRYYS